VREGFVVKTRAYKDTDLFPLVCRKCGNKFKEQVGRLKAGADLWCPDLGCGVRLKYEVKEFLRVLGQARRGLYDFRGDFLSPDARPNLKH
jgi:hypothetical protein